MNEEIQDDINPSNTVILNITESDMIRLDTICRICANQSERIIGIYNEEGLAHELAVKMNLYLPVKVSEDDTLPLHCCWSCASTVLAWHELIINSVEADRRLRELQIIASKQIIETVNEEAKVEVPAEFVSESTAASLSVFYDTAPTSNDDDQSNDVQSLKSEEIYNELKAEDIQQSLEDNFGNSTLNISVIPEDRLKSAEAEDESELKVSVKRSPRKRAAKKTNVDTLMAKIPKKKTECLKEDDKMEMYHFACQYCTFVFTNEEAFLEHVREKHPGQLELPADSLPQNSDKKEKRKHSKIDQEAVNAAKIVVDGRIYYNCKICSKSLHSPYTYMWHMRIHTGERPYVCDLCGKQFRVSQGLVRHLRETHEGIKNFPCDLCGRMFATRRNVEEHRRIHTNERPYICDLCGKAFKQKASLFVHNRSHTDYFPYRCSYCSQGFRTRPPLLIHVTRHTGEKPYPCDICGRCFRIKYELKRHRLVHSDEKPFSCAECGLSFRQKRYLRNHNKTNHNRSTKNLKEDAGYNRDSEYIIIDHCYSESPINEYTSHETLDNENNLNESVERIKVDCKNRRRKADIVYFIFCDVCNKGYTRQSDMERHRKVKHSKDFNTEEIKIEVKENPHQVPEVIDYVCRYCNERFDRNIDLKIHAKSQHGITKIRRKYNEITAAYFCDICTKGFTRKYDMKKHRQAKHPNEETCDSEKTAQSEYLSQFKIVGPDNRNYYKCGVCKKMFKYSYNLLRHQVTHTKSYTHVCHICAKQISSSSGLRRHLTEHHYGVKKFSCEICGQKFAASATREEHMNIHTNNRPFVCDICGKAFKQKASLRSHKLFHTNVYNFNCNFCAKKFRRAYELKTHTWTHTGHRPHQCHLCSSTFRLGQDLKRHLKVHDKLNECACDECGAIFSQQKYLNNHKRSHKTHTKVKGATKSVNDVTK